MIANYKRRINPNKLIVDINNFIVKNIYLTILFKTIIIQISFMFYDLSTKWYQSKLKRAIS